MEISDLERLVALIEGSSIGELTLKQGDSCITLKRSVDHSPIQEIFPNSGASLQNEFVDSSFADELEDEEELIERIQAPLVGIFTNVKPMIAPGAKVKQGQTVCFIEAMNIQSDVKSPVNGIVTDAFIEAGHPVEYGQLLYTVSPDGVQS